MMVKDRFIILKMLDYINILFNNLFVESEPLKINLTVKKGVDNPKFEGTNDSSTES